MRASLAVGSALAVVASSAAHITGTREELVVDCEIAKVGATLSLPNRQNWPAPWTCVLFVGGAHAQTRDGVFLKPGVPLRSDFLTYEHLLVESGYACLRFDQPGFGESKRVKPWSGSYADQARVVAKLLEKMRGRKDLCGVLVLGEDVGAYLACLAARAGTHADGYLFLSPIGGAFEEQYAHEYGRLAEIAARDEQFRAFAESTCRVELALGRKHAELFAAVKRGADRFRLEDDEVRIDVSLKRRREEAAEPPIEQFRHLKTPTLILAGDRDARVPISQPKSALDELRKAGLKDAELLVLKGADHFFRRASADETERLRDHYEYKSFRRPIQGRALDEILAFVRKTAPRSGGR